MTHPLTDKIIEEELLDDQDELLYRTCFPQSYYEGDFRAGADWQLEQVMKWLDENLSHYTDDDYLGDCEPIHRLDTDLKKAMHPTQESN